MIDFNKNCSVLFFFETEKGEVTMLQYERPQFIDDAALDKEARINANDMLKKKVNGVKEIIGIAIARSEEQRKDIMDQIGFHETGKKKL